MKKFIYLASLLLVALGFCGCDDNWTRPPMVYPEQIGDGTGAAPYSVGTALTKIFTGQYTNQKVYVKGVVSKIESFEASYGNMTYYISDDGNTTDELEVYRGLNFGGSKFTSADQLAVGDEVIIYCQLTYYNNSVAETAQGAMLISLNGSEYEYEEPVAAEGDGTQAKPFNVTAAIDYILSEKYTDEKIYVKGKISEIKEVSTSFGNATYYISDSGSTLNQLYVFQGYSLGGKKFTSADEIKVGDDVIVYGQVTLYYSTPEFVKNKNEIYSLNGTVAGVSSDTPSTPSEITGKGTEADPYTANDVLAGATGNDVWVKGIIVGWVDGAKLAEGAHFDSKASVSTNLLIASAADATNVAACVPVQLPSGDVRNALNLQSNPGNYLKEVLLKGNIDTYFQVKGLKSVTEYKIDSSSQGGDDEPVTPPSSESELIYQGLVDGLDGWTILNVTIPEGRDNVWSWNASYSCLYGTAYDSNGNKDSQAYIYTTIDLSAYASASLSYEQAAKFQTTIRDLCGPVARVAGASEWTRLAVPTWCEAGTWNFTPSGDIDLAAFVGKKIEIGFVYGSSAAGADSWEIKNFVVNGKK